MAGTRQRAVPAGTAKPLGATALRADEARRVVLVAQGLCGGPTDMPGLLDRLGAIQLDTISVLARTHELVPYSRLGPIGRAAVEDAYWGRPDTGAFEYWAHALCLMPMADWPYFDFRRRELAEQQRAKRAAGTARSTDSVRREVLARLGDGKVTTSDLGGSKKSAGWFDRSDNKIALESLYWTGEAVCVQRDGWKRVYDLPERALPASLRSAAPGDAECHAHLVARAGAALGVATRRDIADHYRLRLRDVTAALPATPLVPVTVEGWGEPAYAHPDALAAGERPTDADVVTTLVSPFDSLVWERARMQRLFGVSMLFEAYVPKEKRVRGYFTMPLLHAGRIAGFVDPARDGRTLVAHRAEMLAPGDEAAMAAALRAAAAWVGCDQVTVERTEPASALAGLRRALA